MSTDLNQHNETDHALDKVLASMRDAAPPEGMEARIAQRLQHHTSAPQATPFRWRDAFANSARTNEWWRGAITGAAAVLLVTAAFAFAGHLLQPHPARVNISTANRSVATAAAPVNYPSHGAPANETRTQPCAHLAMLRTASIVPVHLTEALRSDAYAESRGQSHRVLGGPLTAQERELLRLAQSADPRLLATLNSEHQTRLEAENAADFAQFFAPPPRPPVPADTPAVNPVANPEASPQVGPKSGSPAASDTSPLPN